MVNTVRRLREMIPEQVRLVETAKQYVMKAINCLGDARLHNQLGDEIITLSMVLDRLDRVVEIHR